MIANITKGRRAQGALIYDFGPGRKEEHVDPRFVAGNVPGTRQQVARIIDHHTRQGELTKPLWRCSLSLPDEDGVLPDSTWSQMAERFITEMGFADCPWVAVRHGDDHIHLTVSRLAWDGTNATDRWDYARARKIADAIEQDFGLVEARTRFKAAGPGVQSGDELAAAKRRGQDKPEREQIRDLVRAARTVAAGQGREAFERELTTAGVQFRANVASTGRMNGYSFSLPGWTSEAGQVWVTASSTAKDLAWKQLGPVLGDGPAAAPAAAPAPEVPDPKRDLARRTLETYRAAARGESVEVDQGDYELLPPKAPQFPRMTQRRYGALAGTDLVRHLAAAEADLPRGRVRLESVTGTLRQVEQAAAGGGGRQLAELNARLARLQQAVGHLDQAAEHKKVADEATDRQREARAEARVAAEAARKKPGLLRGSGRQEKAKAEYADAIGRAEAADKEWRTAHVAEFNETAAARQAAPKEHQPRQALADLTASWPQAEADACAADRANGVQRLKPAREDVEGAQRRVDQTLNAIKGLTEEQQLRAAMPPELRAREVAIRRAVALKQQAEAASRRSTTKGRRGAKKAAPAAAPKPPEPPKRGSGLGR